MEALKEFKLFLFDLDGTIYIDDTLFHGAKEFMEEITRSGGKYIFITNNSSKNPRDYIEKMRRMGIPAERENFITASDAAVRFLKRKMYEKIYVLGTEALKTQFRESGLRVAESIEPGIDCVLVGNDTELTYRKIYDVCSILLGGNADYVATNPDMACPTSFGLVPDCGAICELIGNAVKRTPVIAGKPEPDMVRLAMEKTGVQREKTLVVGDRISTDIACGNNAGCYTALVLTGGDKEEDIEKYKWRPDYIFNDIYQLYCSYKMETGRKNN